MSQLLQGRTIALAESRQLEELAQMLEKEGATVLRCPLVRILDAPEETAVQAWLQQLCAGQFEYVVLLTGEGLRRLLGFAERAGMRETVLTALAQTRTVSRGPKPVRALREVGLTPTLIAERPTTEGVIATLRQEVLQGKGVGLQRYGVANPALEEFLHAAGATVYPVLPYVYAPAADADRVLELLRQMAQGQVDALCFTSSPQVDRLYEVAAAQQQQALLQAGLQRTRIAAIGPVVADNLRQRGRPADICPEQGFVMKNLVQLLKRALGSSATANG